MSILFINGGEKGGNTSALGQRFLAGHDFDQIDLADHKVYDHGQHFDDDEFDQVLARFKQADTIVLGSPVYWHDLSGMIRNLLDRFYGPVAGGQHGGEAALLHLPGSSSNTRDAGTRRVHREPLRRALRHGVHGHGNQCERGCRSG